MLALIAASVPVRVAALALLLVVAYGGSLRAGVAWDDLGILSSNQAIRTLAQPWRFFTDPGTIGPITEAWRAQYRPLRTLLYAAEFAVFRGDAWGYHLVSLLLHAFGAWAAARLAVALFGSGGWLAAAIWLIHPVYAENVLSLAAQGNLLCAALAMASVACHLKARGSGSRRRRVASVAAALGAMAAYESGVLIPLLALIAEAASPESRRLPWRRRLADNLPLWVATVAFLAARTVVTEPVPREPWWGGSWTASLFMQLGLWVEALRITAIPAGVLVRYQPDDVPAWVTPGSAAVLHLTVIGAAVVAALRGRGRVPLLALAWWYLAQVPTSNLLVANLGYPFAPRFLFLAVVLAVVAAGAAGERVAVERPWTWAVLTAAALLALAADRRQVAVWQNNGTIFREMARRKPGDFGAQFNLGWFAYKSGDLAGAREAFDRAALASPRDGRPEYGLGRVALAGGRRELARQQFERSLAKERRQVQPRVRLAELALADGDLDTAARWLGSVPEEARGSGPVRAEVDLALAELAAAGGRCDDAARHASLSLAPAPRGSRTTLRAAAVLGRCGRRGEAHELFRTAAEEAGVEYHAMVGDARAFP